MDLLQGVSEVGNRVFFVHTKAFSANMALP